MRYKRLIFSFSQKIKMKKVALVVLDGFGINTTTPDENAITVANTPTIQRLFQHKHAIIGAS